MKNKITTIRVSENVKEDFRKKYREYPRETDEQILIKLIKGELNADDSKSANTSN